MTIHYFKAMPSSEAAKLAEGYKEKHQVRAKALSALAKELNLPKGVDFRGTESSIWGVTVDSTSPDRCHITDSVQWAWSKKRHCYVPSKLTEGKELAKKLAAIPKGIDWMHESSDAFGHSLFMGTSGTGMCIRFATWAWTKKGIVCRMHHSVKKSAKKWPKGLVEITATEVNEIIPGIEG